MKIALLLIFLLLSSCGYVEPIQVNGLCLSCHGEEPDPAVAAKIQALYPEDAATGFQAGDFRGLFWVTMPLE